MNTRPRNIVISRCMILLSFLALGGTLVAKANTETEVISKPGLQSGELLPGFAFADKDDKRYIDKDYVGKNKLLLLYFIKLGEHNISQELGHLDDLSDAYPDEMQSFVVILNADKAKLLKLSGDRKYAFPMLLGNEKALEKFKLSTTDLPAWVLIGLDGKVLATGGKELLTLDDIQRLSGLPPQPRMPGKRLPGERIAYFFARNLAGMEESTLPLIGDGNPLLLYFTAEKVPAEMDDIKKFWTLEGSLKGVQMRSVIMEPSDDHRKAIAGNKDLKDKGILFGDKTVADLYDTWGRMPMWVLADAYGKVLAVRPNSVPPEISEVIALLSGPQFPGEPVGFSISEEKVVLDKLFSNYAVIAAFSADGRLLAWNAHDRFTATDQLYRLELAPKEKEENPEKDTEKKPYSSSLRSKKSLQDFLKIKDTSKIIKGEEDPTPLTTSMDQTARALEGTNLTPFKPYTGLQLRFDGDIHRLTYSNFDNIAPAWSPTGSELAFHSDRRKYEEIWTMDPNQGGLFSQVTYFRSRAEFPSYTTDGQGMVIGADRLGNMDIWILGPQGKSPYPLVVADGDQNDPSVSPDGKYVVFTWQTETDTDIWKVRMDGKELSNITENLAKDYMAEWSPDGKYVVFVSERSGRPELWICRSDGSGAAQLTNEIGDKFCPNWNYDGLHLIYSRREIDGSFSLVLLTLNGWDPATQVVDRAAAAKAAQASQKTKSTKQGDKKKEERYNPRQTDVPTGTFDR